jgi:glycosyltransferase involved in cell wall biosynthesis
VADKDPKDLANDLSRAREEIQRQEEVTKLLKARHSETEADLRRRLEEASQDARAQRARVKKLYASPTWKIGRFIVAILKAIRHPMWAINRLRGRTGGIAQTAAATIKSITAPSPAEVPDYVLHDDDEMQRRYHEAVEKRAFTRSDAVHIVMAVATLDFGEGRGDVYTAVGLGRYLERIGYEVVYLPKADWYELPERTDVYLALLDDVDLFAVPPTCTRIAWIRNRTTEWVDSPSLQLCDAVLTSSERSASEVRRAYKGPVGLLRIGVDHELFKPAASQARRGVVTTVNQWGRERQLFYALQRSKRDYPLAIYGEQRGLHQDLVPHWVGRAGFFALPSLYASASIVLDDHNHTTQPFGNVNSRVYESLACGTLVVTNASLGLHEIGITDVPVYDAPADLESLIHGFLKDAGGTGALAGKLQEKVLAEHTYEHRAREFDEFYRGLQSKSAGSARRFVGFFPDYRHTNPFQSMLYSWGSDHSIATLPVGLPSELAETALADAGERLVYHLHWTAPILGPAQSEREAARRREEFIESLDRLRARGMRFVWTIHNVMPHECKYPEIEAALRQDIADRADVLHVMCERTSDLARAHFTLPSDRVRILPHPNYIDVYPNVIDEQRAREELGLGQDDIVLCFLGGIRPYKGLEELLDAFDRWCEVDARARLIVAGPAGRFPEVEQLRQRCRSNPRVISNFNHIGDGDLQVFLNASDAVVLPHKAVLNSGSLMLAFSFGRPVIAPAAGCLDDLLSEEVAITFGGPDTDLYAAISRTVELKTDEHRSAAYRKASQYPVNGIAEQLAKIIDEISPPR